MPALAWFPVRSSGGGTPFQRTGKLCRIGIGVDPDMVLRVLFLSMGVASREWAGLVARACVR